MPTWLTSPETAFVLSVVGLLLGLGGVIVGLAGFKLTLDQLKKTKSAIEAAKDAVEQVKSRVATYDLVFEISRASTALREVQRHLKAGQIGNAVESYLTTREALARISKLPSKLKRSQREDVTRMMVDIAGFCELAETDELMVGVGLAVPKALASCREQSDFLVGLEVQISGGDL